MTDEEMYDLEFEDHEDIQDNLMGYSFLDAHGRFQEL